MKKKQFVKTFESFKQDLFKKLNENSINEADEKAGNTPVQVFLKQFAFKNGTDFWNFVLELSGKDFKLLTGAKNPLEYMIKMLNWAGNSFTEYSHAKTNSKMYISKNKELTLPVFWKNVSGTDVYDVTIDDSKKVKDFEVNVGFDPKTAKMLAATMASTGGSGDLNNFLQGTGNDLGPLNMPFGDMLKPVNDGNLVFGMLTAKDSILSQSSKTAEVYTAAANKFKNTKLDDLFKTLKITMSTNEYVSNLVKQLEPATLSKLKSANALPDNLSLNNTEKKETENKS